MIKSRWVATARENPTAEMILPQTRYDAYIAINTERYYQDLLGADRTDGVPRSVGDYVTMMQYYQTKLVEAWTVNPGDTQALEVMRKIAGIAVHCMEDHGSIRRNVPIDSEGNLIKP